MQCLVTLCLIHGTPYQNPCFYKTQDGTCTSQSLVPMEGLGKLKVSDHKNAEGMSSSCRITMFKRDAKYLDLHENLREAFKSFDNVKYLECGK